MFCMYANRQARPGVWRGLPGTAYNDILTDFLQGVFWLFILFYQFVLLSNDKNRLYVLYNDPVVPMF